MAGFRIISSDRGMFETWQNIATVEVGGSKREIPLAMSKDLGRDISIDMFLASEILPGTGLSSSAGYCEPARQEQVRTATVGTGVQDMVFSFDFQGLK